MLRLFNRPEAKVVRAHCEILGSYLQQPLQRHASRAHFDAEPHSQAEANT